jgi:chromosome partitioning protein
MIITIAHTKGGVGKSTLAWNLAHSIKARGEKVTIVDLDFQQTLFFINGIREQDDIEVLQPQSGSELIEIFEEYHGYLIVDVGGFDNDINRIALSWADKIVVPISNSVTEVIGYKTFEAILEEIDNPFVNIVLNNIHPLTKNFSEIHKAIAAAEHTTLLKTIIRNRKVYKDTLGDGKSVFDSKSPTSSEAQAVEEIQGLCDELIQD